MSTVADRPAASAAVAWLRTPGAVRERCNALFALAERDALPHFALDLGRLDAAANLVAEVTWRDYPDRAIPYHSRWRHFEAGGIDRWRGLAAETRGVDRDEIARMRVDLCVLSVLLDAGAGPAWCYREPGTGLVLARSEGLAVASLHAFRAGVFSSDPARPLQADAEGLRSLATSALADALQVTPDNPLAGLSGRAALLRNLGTAIHALPDPSPRPPPAGGGGEETALLKPPPLAGGGWGRGRAARPGRLFDHLRARAKNHQVPAPVILETILVALAPIWPDRLRLDGANLGDVWHHPALVDGTPAPGLVPFHKLAQWLSYSLVEILEDAGIAVTDPDALTGLAEYRNGGLFIDCGVLRPRDPGLGQTALPVAHPAVVEWRALTVALLDRIADPVRARLGRSASDLPLARILQGGTWAAGREVARRLRPDGGPPFRMITDGTVF